MMVLGDFNCHIGTFGGQRSFKESNERGKLFSGLMQRFTFLSVNSQQLCSGPIETFYSNYDLIQTTIDHILIKEDKVDLIKSCCVADDNSCNLSFHRPIICVIQTTLKVKPKYQPCKVSFDWKKINVPYIRDAYHLHNATGLEKLRVLDSSPTNLKSIEQTLDEITTVVKLSADKVIPKAKFKKHLKPFWKDGLKALHDNCRYLRKTWIMHGRPRGSDNSFFRNYKNAKTHFRRELRRKAYEYESKVYERLEKIFEVGNSSFQRIMSKRRKQRGIHTNALKIDGKLIDDPEELRNVWKDHYSELYTPKIQSPYDDRFLDYIKSCLNNYEDQCVNTVYDALDDSFTVDEVSKITAEIPNGKSPGPDGLTNEHIKYGGYAVSNIITTTLNAITSMESVPKQFTVGNIISLYKTNKKNRYDKDNYRGITLLNVVSKIYERLILNR